MAVLTEPYEISIWERTSELKEVGDGFYKKERKISTIAQDGVKVPTYAFNIILKKNVNGETSLGFDMFYKYYDEDTQQLEDNPYIPYMVNERLVKLKYRDEWYDFTIKNATKKTDDYIFSYTCSEVYVQELSKNGYHVDIESDLYNNNGTAAALAERILDDTDWKVESDHFYQYINEPVYQVESTSQTLYVVNALEGGAPIEVNLEKKDSGQSILYLSYNDIHQKKNKVRALYIVDGIAVLDQDYTITNPTFYLTDSNGNYLGMTDKKITLNNGDTVNLPQGVSGLKFVYSRAGKFLVTSQKSDYDPVLERRVWVYNHYANGAVDKDNNGNPKEYYGFLDNDYKVYGITQNLLANPVDFVPSDGKVPGWHDGSGAQLTTAAFPENSANVFLTDNYLSVHFDNGTSQPTGSEKITSYIYNNGIQTNLYGDLLGDGLAEGDIFVFRIKYGIKGASSSVLSKGDNNLHAWIGGVKESNLNSGELQYLTNDGSNLDYRFFDFDLSKVDTNLSDKYAQNDIDYDRREYIQKYKIENGDEPSEQQFQSWYSNQLKYVTMEATITQPWSLSQLRQLRTSLQGKLGFFLTANNASDSTYYIQSIQLYKLPQVYLEERKANPDSQESYYTLETIPTEDFSSFYRYYDPSEAEQLRKEGTDSNTVKDSVKYIKSGTFEPVYWNEQSRSIEVKESNYFDGIQSICETFECWARLRILHNEDGSVKLDENGNVDKTVIFKEYVGKDNYLGFDYQVNLNSIERVDDSTEIVTKMIVGDTSNENVDGGVVSIAAAPDNRMGSNVIYNFDYFIRQGLLNREEVYRDLYDNSNDQYIGYISKYDIFNHTGTTFNVEENGEVVLESGQTATSLRKKLDELAVEVSKAESNSDFYSNLVTAEESELTEVSDSILAYKNEQGANDARVQEIINNGFTDQEKKNATVEGFITDYNYLKRWIPIHSTKSTIYLEQYKSLQAEQAKVQKELDYIINEKKKIDKRFYKKYYPYILEGTWNSDKFTDDNLYYQEALKVAVTSSQPQVTYTFNVIDVAPINGYEDYVFNPGDKTFVTDAEYFGYLDDGVTPYREEVVISEAEYHLDQPQSNAITVQNYKTQFENLFSRIAATVQNVEYHSGSYLKAAGVVNPDGSISSDALQKTLFNKNGVNLPAGSNHINMTEEQIELIDPNDSSRRVLLGNGQIRLSNSLDVYGNPVYSAAISPDGINGRRITMGRINTEYLTIGNDNTPSFSWDSYGLNAYKHGSSGIDLSTFVRLDQYGLYGISGGSADYRPSSIAQVENDAFFGLTWDGFFLKSKYADGGQINITAEDGISIIGSDKTEKVKLGVIGKNANGTNQYGLKIGSSSSGGYLAFNDSTGKLEVGGTIYADSGRFTGEINANTGKIGGFTIRDGKLDGGTTGIIKGGTINGTTIESGTGSFKGTIDATGGSIGGFTIYGSYLSGGSAGVIDGGIIRGSAVTASSFYAENDVHIANANKGLIYDKWVVNSDTTNSDGSIYYKDDGYFIRPYYADIRDHGDSYKEDIVGVGNQNHMTRIVGRRIYIGLGDDRHSGEDNGFYTRDIYIGRDDRTTVHIVGQLDNGTSVTTKSTAVTPIYADDATKYAILMKGVPYQNVDSLHNYNAATVCYVQTKVDNDTASLKTINGQNRVFVRDAWRTAQNGYYKIPVTILSGSSKITTDRDGGDLCLATTGYVTQKCNYLENRIDSIPSGGGGASYTSQISATFASNNQFAVEFSNTYGSSNPKNNTNVATVKYVATNPSDKRLKHNIKELNNNIIDIYENIIPYSFEYNEELNPYYIPGTHFGFIAQEIEGLLNNDYPNNGIVSESDGILSLSYNDFHAMHVMYGQYLKKQIINLEEKLESQSKEIESLKSELNSLKASTEV